MAGEFVKSQGINSPNIQSISIIADFDKAIELNAKNPYFYYDRGTFYVMSKRYNEAIADFDKALSIDKNLAEAYFNRGLAKVYSDNKEEGVKDLSKAGELGLYDAYGILKKYTV